MARASHLSDNLALLRTETARLLETAARLDDAALRRSTLCEGWSRAHVLSHIARNADALANLVHWAVTGEPTPMYASPESRDADIENGARRSAAEIRADLLSSAQRFAASAEGLAGDPEQAEVEMRGGVVVAGGDLPTLRLREVVFHHVDLDAGYSFADADAAFVRRSLSNAVNRVSARDGAPPLSLRSDEGDTWTVAGGGQEVSGPQAALLLWLSRGVGDGVRSDAALPALPAWG